jgi:hypothetical protein
MGLLRALAVLDHLARVEARCPPFDNCSRLDTAIGLVRDTFQLCSADTRDERVGQKSKQSPSIPSLRLQLPNTAAGAEGEAVGSDLAPFDLVTSAANAPGVALCWGGPPKVAAHVLALLRRGLLQECHVTAPLLCLLAELPKVEAMAMLRDLLAEGARLKPTAGHDMMCIWMRLWAKHSGAVGAAQGAA